MARNPARPIHTAEPGLTHYLEEIRRSPMWERPEEYMLANALARARRSRRGAQARHHPSAARDQDRQRLSRLRPADLRSDLRGQYRTVAGSRALRARERLPAHHLRHVVDQSG